MKVYVNMSIYALPHITPFLTRMESLKISPTQQDKVLDFLRL